MKTLGAGLWHMLGVLSGVGYWVLNLLFIWGGFILLGSEPPVGQATLAFVVALFVLRLYVARRVPVRVLNVLSCLAFGLFALGVNIYHHHNSACGVAIHPDGRQERICL